MDRQFISNFSSSTLFVPVVAFHEDRASMLVDVLRIPSIARYTLRQVSSSRRVGVFTFKGQERTLRWSHIVAGLPDDETKGADDDQLKGLALAHLKDKISSICNLPEKEMERGRQGRAGRLCVFAHELVEPPTTPQASSGSSGQMQDIESPAKPAKVCTLPGAALTRVG